MKRVLVLIAAMVGVSAAAQIQLFPAKKKAAEEAKPADPAKEDAKTLTDAKLTPDDVPGLIGYFKKRTLSDEALKSIQAVIQRMGSEDFDERMKASKEAEGIEIAAIGPLRNAAIHDPDPEVQFRALETLRKIEKVSHAAVASAATRSLAKSKNVAAAATLIGFLPMADNAAVEDDIRLALKQLAITNDKLEPALVEAVKDANPVRRAAAAVAMIEASLEQKKLQGDVTKIVMPMLPVEKDDDTKFRVGFVLGTAGRSGAAIKALVETLPGLARGRVWQVEDILLQLAGDKGPKVKLGPDKAALEKGRDEWLKWLGDNVTPEQYAGFDYKPRTTGRIHLLMMDQNWGGGRIVELGADLKPRWKIAGITTPADFQFLSNGNIEIMEHNYSRITERDLRGNVKDTKNLPGGPPMSVQRLENGNILIAYRQSVIEHDSKMKALNTWARNNGDVLYAAKRGNGPVVVLVQNSPNLIRLDDKFKELPNPVKTGQPYYQAKMELLPNDRVLITEQNQVAEYSLVEVPEPKDEKKDEKKDAKAKPQPKKDTAGPLWSYQTNNPTCVQRLPGGNTLVVDMQNRTVKEVTPDKTVVWTYTPPDGLQPMRAYRQ